jgi:ankyrin repeat domain-containing protein 50
VRSSIKLRSAAAYPFRQSTLQKLDEDISEIRDNLSLALEVLQLRDHKNTQDDITELKSLVEVVKSEPDLIDDP